MSILISIYLYIYEIKQTIYWNNQIIKCVVSPSFQLKSVGIMLVFISLFFTAATLATCLIGIFSVRSWKSIMVNIFYKVSEIKWKLTIYVTYLETDLYNSLPMHYITCHLHQMNLRACHHRRLIFHTNHIHNHRNLSNY